MMGGEDDEVPAIELAACVVAQSFAHYPETSPAQQRIAQCICLSAMKVN